MLHRLLPIYKDIKQNLCHHLTRDFNEATAGTLDDDRKLDKLSAIPQYTFGR